MHTKDNKEALVFVTMVPVHGMSAALDKGPAAY